MCTGKKIRSRIGVLVATGLLCLTLFSQCSVYTNRSSSRLVSMTGYSRAFRVGGLPVNFIMGVTCNDSRKLVALYNRGGVLSFPRREVLVFNIQSWRLVRKLSLPYDPDFLSFSSDGSRFVCSNGRRLTAWSTDTWRPAEISLAGKIISYVSDDNIVMWKNGSLVVASMLNSRQRAIPTSLVNASDINVSDKRGVIAVCYPGYIKIFDIRTGRRQKSIRIAAEFIKFSQTGKLLAVGVAAPNSSIQVWDTRTWQLLYSTSKFGRDIDFSPCDSMVVTVEDQVYLREAVSGKEVLRIPACPYSAGFCGDLSRVWMLYDDGRCEFWRIASGN